MRNACQPASTAFDGPQWDVRVGTPPCCCEERQCLIHDSRSQGRLDAEVGDRAVDQCVEQRCGDKRSARDRGVGDGHGYPLCFRWRGGHCVCRRETTGFRASQPARGRGVDVALRPLICEKSAQRRRERARLAPAMFTVGQADDDWSPSRAWVVLVSLCLSAVGRTCSDVRVPDP